MKLAAILEATSNFSPLNLIGAGASCHVYRGMAADGTEWAVKRAKRAMREDHTEFVREVRPSCGQTEWPHFFYFIFHFFGSGFFASRLVCFTPRFSFFSFFSPSLFGLSSCCSGRIACVDHGSVLEKNVTTTQPLHKPSYMLRLLV